MKGYTLPNKKWKFVLLMIMFKFRKLPIYDNISEHLDNMKKIVETKKLIPYAIRRSWVRKMYARSGMEFKDDGTRLEKVLNELLDGTERAVKERKKDEAVNGVKSFKKVFRLSELVIDLGI